MSYVVWKVSDLVWKMSDVVWKVSLLKWKWYRKKQLPEPIHAQWQRDDDLPVAEQCSKARV